MDRLVSVYKPSVVLINIENKNEGHWYSPLGKTDLSD